MDLGGWWCVGCVGVANALVEKRASNSRWFLGVWCCMLVIDVVVFTLMLTVVRVWASAEG